jgi:beta-phosphoglucomutase-like phosphatase (HAD superfamily)
VYVLSFAHKSCLKHWLLGLVVEDAPSGLHSGRAAGSLTLAVCTSLPRATILESDANPNYIVSNLTKYVFPAYRDFFSSVR